MSGDVTGAMLTRGTVFVFARDLSFLGGNWVHRIPGVHFLAHGETSASGYMFPAWDTRRGRVDWLMAEAWVYREIRIIGVIEEVEPQCTCGRE